MKNKILFSDHYIEVQCDRNDLDTQAKMLTYYPVHHNRILTSFKVSTRLIPEILKDLRDNRIDTAPQRVQDYYNHEIVAREVVEDLLLNGPKNNPVVNHNLTLMKHQQRGREIAQVRDRFAYFYDTRTGKTPLALSIINDDLQIYPNHKWLIICPLILIQNAWLEDLATFFPNIAVVNCHDATKAKRVQKIQQDAQIYLTNTESFIAYEEFFYPKQFTGCFVDESSDMKSPSSKISKAIVEFAQTVKRFYLLSGTPAPNGEWEYYMQMRAIDPYCMPASYDQFKKHFFVNLSYESKYEKLALRPDKQEELLDVLKKYSLYVDKEDVLTTPGRTFHEVEFDLPVDLKKHYNTLKNDLYVELQNAHNITAPSAAAKLNKLNQVTSGFIIDTQAIKDNKALEQHEPEWYLLSHYRFLRLTELLMSFNPVDQVIIWCNYKKEFEILKDALKETCACVYGDVSLVDKNKNIKDFKEGHVRYLIANPASADKGLTLTNCHINVYFSLNWSYELFKQSAERIYGDISKQPSHCDYYIFIAKGTIDRILYSDVLQGKQVASNSILSHLKGELV